MSNIELYWMLSSIFFLLIATHQDIKNRLIPDKIWLFQILTGIIIFLWWDLPNRPFDIKLLIGINLVFTLIFAVVAFMVGAYGGGDSKAIISLAFTAPLPFSHTVLQNSIILTLPSILFIMSNMLIFYLAFAGFLGVQNFFHFRRHQILFDGAPSSFLSRLNIFLSAKRVTYEELKENRFLIPAETYDGVLWNLETTIFPGAMDDDEWEKFELEQRNSTLEAMQNQNKEYVWARPLPPGLVFIFLGFLLWITLGSPFSLILPIY